MNCCSNLQTIFLITTLLCSVIKSEPSFETILKRLRSNISHVVTKLALKGRAAYPAGAEGRKKLPTDWTNLNRYRTSSLECGGTYSIYKDGYIRFLLRSKNKGCYHAFLGSKTWNCTVAILCEGTITLNPPGASGCVDEYFTVNDGTVGEIKGCSAFSFSSRPRKARNTGADLYLYYKGSSPKSPCVAFCLQDLTSFHTEIQEAKALPANKNFKGLPVSGSCVCGKRNDLGRIVGGEDALKFEFPWLAAVVYSGYPSVARVPFCGSTLVSDRHLISAAHCFFDDDTGTFMKASEIQVLLHAHVMSKPYNDGSWTHYQVSWTPGWNLKTETDFSEGTIRVRVKEIIVHPLYSQSGKFVYDVAILVLEDFVNLNSGKAAPICLPFLNENFKFKDKDIMTVAGWGHATEEVAVGTRLLQKVEVEFVNFETCGLYSKPTHTHLCAGYLLGGRDSCAGDSGGPLIFKPNQSKNQHFLSGIVSSGVGCARKYKYAQYTNVQEVLQWVYHHIAADGTAQFCQRG